MVAMPPFYARIARPCGKQGSFAPSYTLYLVRHGYLIDNKYDGFL